MKTSPTEKLGAPKMLILGLQHMFAMFGATVLVPIITGLSIQVTLLCAGVGTLLFHLFTKLKVPAFLGSSFAFLGGFAAIKALNTGIYANMSEAEKLSYACGGVVVAGALYLVLALLFKLLGPRRVMRFLPPVVTGPIIILIGVILAPNAINDASNCWWLAVLAFAIIVACNIWGKGMIKILPILIGLVVSYVVALCFNMVDFTAINEAKWFGLPPLPGMGGSFAKFDLTAILIMAPIALATMMEHIGDISAISATTGQDFISDPGLHRTLLGDGIATSLAGLVGGPANTTYGENTGVLALSKVYNPSVIRVAAGFAILLSFSPKVAAVIQTIPTAIIGGISFILYGMISAVGVRTVVENRVDFTKTRNLVIAAVVLVSGLGFNLWGYDKSNLMEGLTFQIGGVSVTLTGLAIAALLGIIINAILPGKDYEFGKDPQGDTSVNFKV